MKYYCIGIKGTGMSTLAQMLSDMGNVVSGYDDAVDYKFTQKGLDKRGIKIYYDDSYNDFDDVIITASKAFKSDHKELKRITDMGYKITPYNEVVGMITKEFRTISVCGTHGKTTTTSLLEKLFDKCNYFIGDGRGHIDKDNKLLVIESDEFNRHFLAYSPKVAIITCVELEHTEIYHDLEDTIRTFEKFVNKAEVVIANGDDKNIREINFNNQVMFYGESDNNDYVIKNIDLNTNGSNFSLYKDNSLIGDFFVPLYGKHMVYNTASSIICALNEGVSVSDIKERLKTFTNADRRFQEEVVGNTIIVDDYAHHPTEIKVTLEAVRQKYPDKQLTVIFRPNTYSRTSHFKNEFAESLKVADNIFITPILCDRERKEDYPPIKSEDIIELLDKASLVDEESIAKVLPYKDGIICFMGCATVSHLIENFKNLLQKENA